MRWRVRSSSRPSTTMKPSRRYCASALCIDVGHASFLSFCCAPASMVALTFMLVGCQDALSSTAKPSPASSMPPAPPPRKRRAPPDSVRMEDVARAAGRVGDHGVARAERAGQAVAGHVARGARGHRAAALRAQPDGRQPGIEPLAHRGGDRADGQQLDLLRHHRRPGPGAGAASLSVAARADATTGWRKRARWCRPFSDGVSTAWC